VVVRFWLSGLTFSCVLFVLGTLSMLATSEVDLVTSLWPRPMPVLVTVAALPIMVYMVGLAFMVRGLVRMRRVVHSL
jgi:hypothetical protein